MRHWKYFTNTSPVIVYTTDYNIKLFNYIIPHSRILSCFSLCTICIYFAADYNVRPFNYIYRHIMDTGLFFCIHNLLIHKMIQFAHGIDKSILSNFELWRCSSQWVNYIFLVSWILQTLFFVYTTDYYIKLFNYIIPHSGLFFLCIYIQLVNI